MTTRPVRGSLIAAACLAATLLHVDAFGAEPRSWGQGEESFAFDFRFDRADLDTQRGAQSVYRTLVYKATQACSIPGDPAISLHRTDTACVASLVERVVRQIGVQTLSGQWQRSRWGRSASR